MALLAGVGSGLVAVRVVQAAATHAAPGTPILVGMIVYTVAALFLLLGA